MRKTLNYNMSENTKTGKDKARHYGVAHFLISLFLFDFSFLHLSGSKRPEVKRCYRPLILIPLFSFLILGCARMGNPDGGWYDDTPPYVVNASPNDGAINVESGKIIINFNEYIKVEDPQSKVIVSPPQLETPDIKASGKRIIVDLKDSLKSNTTYTIDFSDAITDNNENNPMGNYTFSFSTGDHIDTLEVSGYCLNAEDLEPIKGMLVGLYNTDSIFVADTINTRLFHTTPMMRVSRTNGSGLFTIKGITPGRYCVYALKDADGDFLFGQKSETIGYLNDSIRPTWMNDTRQDTIWRDSLHINNIVRTPYIHFLPDDITLLCFQEPQTDRYLVKTERQSPEKLGLFFSYGNDSMPRLRGLNFESDSAFVLEASVKRDTLFYWLRDTALVNQDTLSIELTYLMTDTLGKLVEQCDTTEFLAKVSFAKRQKDRQKEIEKWQKEQEKKKKREEPYDSIMPVKPLQVKVSPNGQIDPMQTVSIEMPEPLLRCDTTAIYLKVMVDSVWHDMPHELMQTSTRIYTLNADWQPNTEYRLIIDSAAFQGLYGLVNDSIKQTLKVRSEEEYATLVIELKDVPTLSDSSQVVVQLMESGDKVVRQAIAGDDMAAAFFYLKPSKYYLRCYIDLNGNGQWDTGLYDADLQAEPVYYHPEVIECKAKWDATRQWNLNSVPLYKQKPLAITKQKPDKAKQLRNRNVERAQKLGITYLQGQGVITK